MAYRVTMAGALFLASSLLLLGAQAPESQPQPQGRAFLGLEGGPAGGGKAGILVRSTEAGSPADKAGIKPGDVLTRVEGKKLDNFDTLAEAVKSHKPGDKLTLGVTRDDQKERDVTITLGSRSGSSVPPGTGIPKGSGPSRGAFLGVRTEPLSPDRGGELGVSVEKGALVTDVRAGTPAAKAGIKDNDVITALDDQKVTGPEDLREAIGKLEPGKEVTVKVARGKETRDLRARLEAIPAGSGFPLPGAERPMFPGIERPMFPGGNAADLLETPNKVRSLEQKVQDLEKRIRELEQKVDKSSK